MRASIFLAGAAAAVASAASNDTMITSTILATSTSTVLSCAPTVTNCPVGKVTQVVYTTTTICPATAVYPPAPPPTSTPVVYSASTKTFYSTNVYTITSCAPTVTNCPVGSKTSSVVTYTSVAPPPGKPTSYTAPPVTYTSVSPPPSTYVISKPASTTSYVSPPPAGSSCAPIISYVTVTASPSAVKPSSTVAISYGTAVPTPKYNATTPTTVPFTGGASAQKAGSLFMAVGLAAALL